MKKSQNLCMYIYTVRNKQKRPNPSNIMLIITRSVTTLVLLFVSLVSIANSQNNNNNNNNNVIKAASENVLGKAKRIQLVEGAFGGESIAFDPNGEGPYTGVADGRVLKWLQHDRRWVDFAVTSSNRKNCSGAAEMEHICGRPLGLKFDEESGDLYIADAYFGLQVVGPSGGLATPLLQEFEGHPLLFTNDLDIHYNDSAIYFTDTSTNYQRREFLAAIVSGDMTGKLMKYDKSTKQVTILLQGLAFANGVALSKDGSFVLVAETSNFRILRYWIKGPHMGNHDIFAELPGFPDNVRVNSKGEFWVALSVDGQPRATAIKLSEDGQVMEVLEDIEGKRLRFISEVHEEKNGQLWFGSVRTSFLGIYKLS